MSNKNKLPWYVKQNCLAIVRGYNQARKEYLRMRKEILDAGGAGGGSATPFVDPKTGETMWTLIPTQHVASRSTENKAMRLEALEQTAAYKQIKAVEHAQARIGEGLPEPMRDLLRDGLMINCMNGRKYSFERLYIVGICRSDFYRYRDQFFRMIAAELGLF